MDYLLLIRLAMEVKLKRYVINYENGNKVAVYGKNLDEALEEFKKLRIETATKEIRVMMPEELFQRYKKDIDG